MVSLCPLHSFSPFWSRFLLGVLHMLRIYVVFPVLPPWFLRCFYWFPIVFLCPVHVSCAQCIVFFRFGVFFIGCVARVVDFCCFSCVPPMVFKRFLLVFYSFPMPSPCFLCPAHSCFTVLESFFAGCVAHVAFFCCFSCVPPMVFKMFLLVFYSFPLPTKRFLCPVHSFSPCWSPFLGGVLHMLWIPVVFPMPSPRILLFFVEFSQVFYIHQYSQTMLWEFSTAPK